MTEAGAIADSICTIPLTKGLFAVVDKCDYERLSQYKWFAKRCGHSWYAARGLKGRTYFMHWGVLGRKEGFITDHINGNGLDNRRENLRFATQSENRRNRRKWQGKNYKGVRYREDMKKWEALIRVDGKLKSIGYFDRAIEAARAYDRAALEHFGEFARINEYSRRKPESVQIKSA